MQDEYEYQPTEISTSVQADGLVVVHVYGEVDMATAPDLRAAASYHLAAGRNVAVDLAETTFMDASGVSALLAVHGAARRVGRSLTVLHASHRPVARVLQLSGVTDVLSIRDPDLRLS